MRRYGVRRLPVQHSAYRYESSSRGHSCIEKTFRRLRWWILSSFLSLLELSVNQLVPSILVRDNTYFDDGLTFRRRKVQRDALPTSSYDEFVWIVTS